MSAAAPAAPAVSKEQAEAIFSKGLEGIIAGETAICSIEQGGLWYRGYEIHDPPCPRPRSRSCCSKATSPRPTSSSGSRVNSSRNAAFPRPWSSSSRAWAATSPAGARSPWTSSAPRSASWATWTRTRRTTPRRRQLRKTKRLLAKIPTIIGHMQNVIDGRAIVGRETGGDPSLDHAANLLYLMTGEKPTPEYARVIDVSLILYAEHDFNASTFTGRVIAGTSATCTAPSPAASRPSRARSTAGPTRWRWRCSAEIMKRRGREAIGTSAVDDWMQKAFDTKRKLMGFGHRVYKNGDHRAPILHKLGRNIAARDTNNVSGGLEGHAASKWFDLGEQVQKIMLDKKKIHPNVDFPCGLTYYSMGIPVPQYTPIFVASRITGWCAHIMEQHVDDKLIRPLSKYTGPAPRKWNG